MVGFVMWQGMPVGNRNIYEDFHKAIVSFCQLLILQTTKARLETSAINHAYQIHFRQHICITSLERCQVKLLPGIIAINQLTPAFGRASDIHSNSSLHAFTTRQKPSIPSESIVEPNTETANEI
ncbi:hypothetical protein IF2G_05790 [Cordyceps javanica]|nr:hypothetical protein IF2G_05790 [Cordyceps javanica]